MTLKVKRNSKQAQPADKKSNYGYGFGNYKRINMNRIPAWFKKLIAGASHLRFIIPLDIYQAHIQMSRIWMGKGEYMTILEIADEGDGVYRVVDYYLPYHDAGGGYARLNRRGAIDLATTQLERLENMYGHFHIHPGYSNYTSQQSGVDVRSMWTWISNADRGIDVVSNSAGMMSATFVGKDEDTWFQLPMEVEIDWSMESGEVTALRALMAERITHGGYAYGDYPKVIHVPASKTSFKDTPKSVKEAIAQVEGRPASIVDANKQLAKTGEVTPILVPPLSQDIKNVQQALDAMEDAELKDAGEAVDYLGLSDEQNNELSEVMAILFKARNADTASIREIVGMGLDNFLGWRLTPTREEVYNYILKLVKEEAAAKALPNEDETEQMLDELLHKDWMH